MRSLLRGLLNMFAIDTSIGVAQHKLHQTHSTSLHTLSMAWHQAVLMKWTS